MKLFKIERQTGGGYDTFDMAVVAANTAKEAQRISPNGWQIWVPDAGWVRKSTMKPENYHGDWTSPNDVEVTLIGTAKPGTESGVIVARFNAG